MFVIIGAGAVIFGVIGGYLMEHGNLSVLFQPAEVVIIGGAAFGSFLIMSPPKAVKLVMKHLPEVIKPSPVTKELCIELLMTLNKLFRKARQEGMLALEQDINEPHSSPCFTEFKQVISKHELVEFICDNFKVAISAGSAPHELENMMDVDIEARHMDEAIPSAMIKTVGDALPGLGIVAAVLGVVITMGKISEPPEVLGHSIGAALVGTFLGVLACYGFVGPLGTNLEMRAKEGAALFNVIKTAIAATVSGSAPMAALEYGRRAIPGSSRPSIQELDEAIKKWGTKEQQ
ncbi:MAG: flagellar motor stator protein MotA [Desulfobacteraceae bacterium]|nr:flagellar motor stator protein MotA [Desulfobacteraceae bacterium]